MNYRKHISSRSAGNSEIAGHVERVTFHNAENGFCVLRVKVRGRRELESVVGHTASVSAGEWINATGEWINDRNYGRQFRASVLETATPNTRSGIEKYLGSGMVRGVGPVYARKLVEAFGEDVFDIIDREPDRLGEIPGIGPWRTERITAAWAEQKSIREIMVFLHGHGVGTARAVRIYRTYGERAVQVMSENPYQLVKDIRGIGFKTGDAIAMKLGFEKTAMIRVRAGISFALTRALQEGHCGLPRGELLHFASELLEVPEDLVEQALAAEVSENTLVADEVERTECIFLSGLHRAEAGIARELTARIHGRPPWPSIDADKAIPWVEKRTGMSLAESQRKAVRMALREKAMVITGGPGVGKTTIVNAILKILAVKKIRMLLCAPTGRAAKQMSEVSGRAAKTIHRLLEIDPRSGGFRRDAENPLECDLLVVDEMSMVDVPLAHALLRAVPPHAALLLVGDVDQLPSVGPGRVLADMIGSQFLPVIQLTEVFRQAAQSQIIVNAHEINRGVMIDLRRPEGDSDFYFVEADHPDTAAERVLDLVSSRIPRRFSLDAVRDIQVLCPMNRGAAGAISLNLKLQAALNPSTGVKVERFGWTFAPGDKVMQVENDYDKGVYNGDIGFVRGVDEGLGEIGVEFDGNLITYSFGELDSLVPAYATTIHKSQGSEYPAIVIPILSQHYVMLQRNLLYTGVTRARRLAVLVGQKKAVAMAIRNAAARKRWTKLGEWLHAAKN